MRGRSCGVVMVLVALLVVARASSSACASQAEGLARLGIGTVAISAGVATLIFGLADISYSSRGRWLPSGWATAQLLVGGGLNIAAGAVLVAASKDARISATWAAIPFTLAAAFSLHAVLSLVLRKSPPKRRKALLVPLLTRAPGGQLGGGLALSVQL